MVDIVDINLWCFLFYQKMCIIFKKNAILCLFLKNVSPSTRVICFILKNSHLSMVEGIAFYALYKSRVLIIPCEGEDSCLFIGLPYEIYTKARRLSLSNFEVNFFIVLQSNLKETLHYQSYMVSNIKKMHSALEQGQKNFFLVIKKKCSKMKSRN